MEVGWLSWYYTSECNKRGSSNQDWRLIVLPLGYYLDVIFEDAWYVCSKIQMMVCLVYLK